MSFASSHHRPSARSLRVLRWLLCQLLPAWLCLSLGWVASAAAADEGAPMCDPHAASVAAVPEIPEVDRGKLEELPCDALVRWLGSGIDLSALDGAAADGAPPPAPELQLTHSRPDGVLSIVVAPPARAEAELLPPPEFRGLPRRAGHRTPIFRPPVRSR